MPVPQHVFDPPFNIIRASHVVLDVTDLDRSVAFYENIIGLHVEDRDETAAYLRGSEEHQHHSVVLRKAGQAAAAISATIAPYRPWMASVEAFAVPRASGNTT